MSIEAYYKDDYVVEYEGHVLDVLRRMPAESVHMVITSPPYFGLRSYGLEPQVWPCGCDVDHSEGCEHGWGDKISESKSNWKPERTAIVGNTLLCEKFSPQNQGQFCQKCGSWRGDLGNEPEISMYIDHLVLIFREVWRVLRNDGVMFLNIADSFAGGGGASGHTKDTKNLGRKTNSYGAVATGGRVPSGLKPKDLCGIPWSLAFALRDDGWWLRSDTVWCLSGGTWLYVKSQKGEMPMTIKDMVRLDPRTTKVWNGKDWIQILGYSKSPRKGTEIELVLISGERISCSENHKFPTNRGLLEAKNIQVGDMIDRVFLPNSKNKDPEYLNSDIAWFLGLYLAEGCRSNGMICIAGHVKETARVYRLQRVVNYFGASMTQNNKGNNQIIRIYSRILNSVIDEFISGRTAKDKGLKVSCWKLSNYFLMNILKGYLSGDGHWDVQNNRWRIGFTRNYNLERDLRILAARLDFELTLNLSKVRNQTGEFLSFRGEIRFEKSKHGNVKYKGMVKAIRKARCRWLYDIGVDSEDHLFALASGVLTHNSKPSCMPESLNGWRWERCRVKVGSKRKETQSHAAALGTRDHSGDFSLPRNQDTEYVDCPGCDKCDPNDGYVLRKGSWRPTSSHEYVFMLAKSERYFADGDAVRETINSSSIKRWGSNSQKRINPKSGESVKGESTCGFNSAGRNLRSVWTIDDTLNEFLKHCRENYGWDVESAVKAFIDGQDERKDVFTINPEPTTAEHFAAFPSKLCEIAIKAGTSSKGCCSNCGSPYVRVVEKVNINKQAIGGKLEQVKQSGFRNDGNLRMGDLESKTIGWRPSCQHKDLKPVPCTVLDPFSGSGRALTTARRLGRKAIGIDLKREYLEMPLDELRRLDRWEKKSFRM